MLKKFLIGAGAFASLITIGYVGIGAYKNHEAAQYNDTAIPYIKSAIPEISKWDKDIFYNYLSSEAKENIDKDDMANIFIVFSKMGSLISYEDPEFSKSDSYAPASGETKTIVTYNVDAKYENGDATLTFTLVGVNEKVELHHFNLRSIALLQ